jgi:hypothetical protein
LRDLALIKFFLQPVEALSVVCLLGAEILYALVRFALFFRYEFLFGELVVVFYCA